MGLFGIQRAELWWGGGFSDDRFSARLTHLTPDTGISITAYRHVKGLAQLVLRRKMKPKQEFGSRFAKQTNRRAASVDFPKNSQTHLAINWSVSLLFVDAK